MSKRRSAGEESSEPEPAMVLADADLPAFFIASDQASLTGQRKRTKTLATMLIFTVLAAVSGAFTVKIAGRHFATPGVISGLAFLAALGCSIYLLQARPEQNWYVGRAAAESTRTLAWLYAVGGGLFNLQTCTDPEARLLDLIANIANQLGHTNPTGQLSYLADRTTHHITDKMKAIRGASLAVRKSTYLTGRIDQQLDWYKRKARLNAKAEVIWLRVTLGLQLVGLVVALASAFGEVKFDLLGLIAAAAAATAAWLEAKDHGTLAAAYHITAFDLSLARDRAMMIEPDDTETTWADFVESAEFAISREHTLWLARGGIRWQGPFTSGNHVHNGQVQARWWRWRSAR